ncbi:aldehyde oxidase 1 [Microcaecilia unicolor]|uniref:aldehyde oxidase n=1 Tax=Microcaecilia unicolor TaxID=1415580 RepID=A0A6P7YEK4_9AMPH|nr:aldehyde oxidase 1-like [Microcaecilia unicolor]
MATSRGSDELIFFVNGKKIIEKNADPEEMLLSYLRKKLRLTGTKYGCGGGGCGACTVMVSRFEPVSKKILHYTVNACLLPICSLYGAAVTTVEGIGSTKTRIHPVQERIAKAHGSQCGFCTPGMVMSMYTLLRNHSEPTLDQIYEALAGNLCRCTGYRPIIDGCKTFCKKSECCLIKENGVCCLDEKENESSFSNNDTDICTALFNEEEFLPLDPTQELIFPPELLLMDKDQRSRILMFHGERITWISPTSLTELLELKVKHPKAPLVMGNTIVGPEMKFRGIFHPVIISLTRVLDLSFVNYTEEGVTVGAASSLTLVKDTLTEVVSKLPEEKTKILRALLQQLSTLAGPQIRNTASLGGNIISKSSTSDLNPILAVSNCTLTLASKERTRQIPLDETFFDGLGQSALKSDEILLSVHIPYSRKWEFVYAFRQAPRRINALPIVNAGMRVLFKEGTDIIQDVNIFFGGVGRSTVCAKKTCQRLKGCHWNEEMLNEACRQILDEVALPGSAPGGMVEYRRTLTISFLFKFYLEILQQLKQEGISHNEISVKDLSALEGFQEIIQQNTQIYQDVSPGQLSQDPVGRPIVHQSGIKHATGEAVYCDDMQVIEGELFLAFVTSTRPHAKIISMNVSDALKVPGVVDIITDHDVPGTSEICSIGESDHLFAGDKVLCVGHIICAVVADSPAHAKRGAEQVKIVYEELEPIILTIQDAIKHSSFLQPKRELEEGNVDDAFKTVDQVVEGEIYIGGQEHFYMETQSVRVVPRGEDNEMDVYASTQYPTNIQEIVAAVLNVPSNRIFCHVKRVGGAFGGKVSKTAQLAAIAAVAANKTGCAVRCILERGDDMLITGGRHPFLSKYKVGCMNDGRIVAADVTIYSNGGYSLEESGLVIQISLLHMDSGYRIPNLRCCGLACMTNLRSNTAFRGFGYPQAALITETWVDAVATKCGLPSEKVREINMHKDISKTHYKQEFDAKNLRKCWNECLENSSYYNRRAAIEDFNKHNYWKKRGIAMIPAKFPIGIHPKYFGQAAALVHIYTDGSVLVTHGGIEMGQGLHTKIMQVASRELKIPLSYIHLCETSTVTVPNSGVTGGSSGTDCNGMAVKSACQTLLCRLEPVISKNPGGKWEDWVKEAYLQSISLSATGIFRGYDVEMNWEKKEGHPVCYFVYGVACSEVVIDCLTGDHKNIRTDIVMDVGCSINPAVDIGQIEGAFVQGLGLFTMEELKFSPQGVLYTRGPSQYKIPATCDIPEQFHVSLLTESPNPHAIYSSKGIGEPAVFLGSSVYFAIKDAVMAARKERGLTREFMVNSPLTPERIRMACGDHFTDMIPRDDPGSYTPWAINV